MSVGYKRDPRPASTTPSQASALSTFTLLGSAERIRQQEEDIRILNERIRAAVRQTTRHPRSPSLLNILLFGLGIMLTERVEDGDASVRRVFQILDDILVLILDPAFEDLFGDGHVVVSSSDGGGMRREQSHRRGRGRDMSGEGFVGGDLASASEAA